MSEIITVTKVDGPGAGKKQGTVKDTQGRTWYVYPDKLHLYVEHCSYEIKETSVSNFNGRAYVTIRESSLVGGVAGPQTPTPAQTPRQAAPQHQVSAPPMPQDDTQRRMDIFICGAFNNAMANPNVLPMGMEAKDMVLLITRLKQAWINTLGGGQRRSDDMNDEIPF